MVKTEAANSVNSGELDRTSPDNSSPLLPGQTAPPPPPQPQAQQQQQPTSLAPGPGPVGATPQPHGSVPSPPQGGSPLQPALHSAPSVSAAAVSWHQAASAMAPPGPQMTAGGMEMCGPPGAMHPSPSGPVGGFYSLSPGPGQTAAGYMNYGGWYATAASGAGYPQGYS